MRLKARGPRFRTLLAAALVAAALVPVGPAHGARRRKKSPAVKSVPAPLPRPHDPFRVTIPTDDGVALAATWRPLGDVPAAPAVLLIHAFSRERREWEPLAAELGLLGYSTLAIDLRAHGETRKNGAVIHLSPSLQRSPSGFPRDVEAACAWLRERSSRIGVVGLSIGGELAILATASGWADAAVAVSPNADRVPALAGPRPQAAHGTLVLASEGDVDRAASARALTDAGLPPKRMLVFAGAAHGMALLSRPEVKKEALDWLGARLAPGPPPTPTVTPAVPAPPPATPGTAQVG